MNIGLTKCISLDPTKLVAFRVIKNCVYCTKFGETVQKDEIWDFRGKWFWKFWNVMWGLVPLRPFDQNSLSLFSLDFFFISHHFLAFSLHPNSILVCFLGRSSSSFWILESSYTIFNTLFFHCPFLWVFKVCQQTPSPFNILVART